MNTLYPIFLKLENKPALVVGGGNVAEQKVRGLLDVGANVTVISPKLTDGLEVLVTEHRISVHRREYRPGDVEGYFLVFAAANDASVHQEVFNDAVSRNIPVNVVDVPELCNFYLSSLFQKGDLKIAVSTNGKSPTLGKIIRDRIADEFSVAYPELLETLGGMRPHVQKSFPDFASRKETYEQLVHTELERLPSYSRKPDHTVEQKSPELSKVYLVGAGPGDPELITVKGMKLLCSAEVIIYDAMVNKDLLSLAPVGTERIYVGKRAGSHCTRQEDINELLILKAREGKRVVRLKGGDPFIFGRGGEEVEALRNAGLDVEIVPGITAGIGVPASLGIPLTHRKLSSSVVFITGHEDPAKNEERIDWAGISRIDTIVVYMGIRRIQFISEQLMNSGVSPLRPVACLFGGTLPEEIVITGTLQDIGSRVSEVSTDSPGLIIVGDVVGFLDSRNISMPDCVGEETV